MPLFKKKKWKDYTHNEFTKLLRKMSQYKQLKRLIGDFADDTVEAIWLQGPGKFGKASHMNTQVDKENFLRGNAKLLQTEINNFLAGHYHIGALHYRARFGQLRAGLRDDPKAPGDYGALEGDSELEKAAKWIVNSSSTLAGHAEDESAPVNLTKIRAAMRHVVDNMDVRSWQSIAYLHQRLVDQSTLQPSRGVYAEAKYCSIGGARKMLEVVFDLFGGTTLPANGDEKWDDLACYAIGAAIRAHGFTDGNGRVARALFACVLLKGGRPFVAIKSTKEKVLHGLNS